MPIFIKDLGMRLPKKDSKRPARFALYRCDCGNLWEAQVGNISRSENASCGCKIGTKHGLTHHRLYRVWSNMLARTTNPNHKQYKTYGARGINVCDRWLSVANFIDDMDDSFEDGLTIDRIDNDKGYRPGNCRWATYAVQARNKQVITTANTSGYKGVTFRKDKITKPYQARLMINKKSKSIGFYDTALEAAIAYNRFIDDNNLDYIKNKVEQCMN